MLNLKNNSISIKRFAIDTISLLLISILYVFRSGTIEAWARRIIRESVPTVVNLRNARTRSGLHGKYGKNYKPWMTMPSTLGCASQSMAGVVAWSPLVSPLSYRTLLCTTALIQNFFWNLLWAPGISASKQKRFKWYKKTLIIKLLNN